MKLDPALLRSAGQTGGAVRDFSATLEARDLFDAFQFVIRLPAQRNPRANKVTALSS